MIYDIGVPIDIFGRFTFYIILLGNELDGPAVSAFSVRSRALVGHQMRDQNFLSRAPPCFGRHVKPVVPAAFAVVSIH
jgi:hypothetical protein